MAQNIKLSWFQRRTAAYNKAFGTKLSPSILYRTQNLQSVQPIIQRLQSIGDPRAKGAPAKIEGVKGTLNSITWATLAGADTYTSIVLGAQGDGYISRGGTVVYTIGADGVVNTYNFRTSRWGVVQRVPRDAVRLTPTEVDKLLRKRARNIKAYRHGRPIDAYPPALYEA